MRNLFILLANAVLIQAVDITTLYEQDIDQGAVEFNSELNFAQTVKKTKPKLPGRGRPNSPNVPNRPKGNTQHPTTTKPPNRPRANTVPDLTTPTSQHNRPTTTVKPNRPNTTVQPNRPNTTVQPNRPERPDLTKSKNKLDKPDRALPNRQTRPNLPDHDATRPDLPKRKTTTNLPDLPTSPVQANRPRSQTMPELSQGKNSQQNHKDITTQDRLERQETVSRVRSKTLPESRVEQAEREPLSAVDKLEIGQAITELPAMIAQTTLNSLDAKTQLDLSRKEHKDNYNLAVKQNNQEEQDRIRQDELALENQVLEAQYAEIEAIQRSKQKVAEKWAEAKTESEALENDLQAVYQAKDDLDSMCLDPVPAPPECDNAWDTYRQLRQEEADINAEFVRLDAEMDEMIDVQTQLNQLEEDFCADAPAEFAPDCLMNV